MSNPILLWALLLLAVVVDILFSLIRASFLHVQPHQMLKLEDEDEDRVAQTTELMRKPITRITFYVANAFSNLLVALLAYQLIESYFPEISNGSLFLLTFLCVVVLLALEHAFEGRILNRLESWALRMTPITRVLTIIFRPISAIYINLLGSPSQVQSLLESGFEDELKSWAKETRDNPETEGELEQEERKMIYSIFQLGDTLCREIMVPRIEIFSLDVNTSLREAAEAATESGHSRVPVFEDRVDNIIGMLYVKDLLKVKLNGDGLTSIRDLLRPAYFVPETKKVSDLLKDLREREVHLAVVVDEYGGTAGLVTLEDIVEEIVGEIRDEYDQAEELPYQQISENDFIFQGRIDLDDFNDYMDVELPKEMAETLSGYVYRELGHVPMQGETLDIEEESLKLTVIEVIGRRITKVQATTVAPKDFPEDKDELGGERKTD
ncbi:MAG: HlyC/CorC family transporter [Anaerolineaceae bacterium]|nr:HlyC/CorC family transporter [Anaerolineaceae bacterium]